MSNLPSELKYDKEHTYVRLEGNIATVGVTDFAQRQLGEVVMVELQKVGDKFEAGEPLGTIESVKAAAEIYSPVTGTIQEVNSEITYDPESVSLDPYGEGWLVKIKVDDTSSVENLLTASQYEQYIKEGE